MSQSFSNSEQNMFSCEKSTESEIYFLIDCILSPNEEQLFK